MTIIHLLNLDFHVVKSLIKTLLFGLGLSIFLGIILSPVNISLFILMFIVFLLNTMFSITEKNSFKKFYGILPVKKQTVILSRYLFAFLTLFMFSLISLILYCIIHYFQKNTFDFTNGLQIMLLYFILATFFISIQFPIYYYLGPSKASVIGSAPYFISFAFGIPATKYLMKNPNIYEKAQEFIYFMETHNSLFILTSLLLILVMIIISFTCSIEINKSKLK